MINNVKNLRFLRYSIIFIIFFIATSTVWAQWQNAFINAITNTQIRKETVLQSLDLDSNDYAHLVWKQQQEPGIWHIYYSTNSPAGVWLQPEMVSDSTQTSTSPGLAVSPISDHPFIVFEQDSEIYFAYQSGAIWESQQVTSNSQLDCSPTIAVDNTGNIHLAWITDDPGSGEYKIAYTYGDTINWDIQTLAGSTLGPYGTGASPFIAVSSQGVAHIVYRGGTYGNYHIHHAWNDTLGGSNWNYETILSGNVNDFSCSLVIEENGDLHLAVSGNDGWGFPGRVYYFYQPEGQSWEPFELSSLTYSAVNPSIDVDVNRNPHIVWMETSGNFYTGNIFYSHEEETGNWQVSSVISGDYFSPSFKVDNQNFGHVGCHTGGNTGIYDIYHIQSGESLTPVEAFPSYEQESHSYYLLQNYPNPFNPETTITFNLTAEHAEDAELVIYNLKGQKVKQFSDIRNQTSVVWDGTDDNNQPVSSGIYFYKLQTQTLTETRKMILLK
ncbi:MAG: T9SS type A sorting domain-containing protein [Candidatus Cloacimonetes bacterium]|nr:T9SS type A sorting domain-containing protein [Candidatus Cloacimonadota bacterium]